MQRLDSQPRPNWQKIVESQGLWFHTLNGEPYWDESHHYLFDGHEIDDLERATYALNEMCLAAVERVIRDKLFERFQIPAEFAEWVEQSWNEDEHAIYGRFDLVYDGTRQPALLEYNADTPTAVLEAAAIQWFWFQDYLAASGNRLVGYDTLITGNLSRFVPHLFRRYR